MLDSYKQNMLWKQAMKALFIHLLSCNTQSSQECFGMKRLQYICVKNKNTNLTLQTFMFATYIHDQLHKRLKTKKCTKMQ